VAFNVGQLVATLRLDMDQFSRGMTEAQAQADRLDEKNVDVKVKADTAEAETKLAAVAASEDKVSKSSKPAAQGLSGVVQAAILLGPALVPIAAGAAGLAVGFGAMGTAGVLAIVGISQAMTHGTDLGGQYSTMLATLKGDLSTLGATAAGGVLTPFSQAVSDLQAKMPTLNTLIGEFSGITGKAAGALVSGLVAAFIALAPLARDADVYILALSNRFAAMMSGPGVVAFGDYVRSVFPQVMQTITSLGDAVIHLVAALAPLGMGVLSVLQTFSSVIAAIPVPVLTALAGAATAVYIAVSLFKLLSGPIGALSKSLAASAATLQDVGISAEMAAAGVRTLTIAAGVIGAVVAVATLAYSAFADSQRANTQAANSLTDALIRGKGAIDDQTVSEKANALAKDGTLAAGKLINITYADMTGAALGLPGPLTRVNEALKKTGVTAFEAARYHSALNDAVTKVSAATKNAAQTLDTAKQAYDAYNAATAKAAAGGNAQAAAQQALAARIGTTAAALATATAGQQTTADATAAAAAKMYIESDAAGMLKTQLDILNGKSLSLMQAQTADAAATNSATTALKTNKSAIEGTSAAAVANQQALQNKALASQAEAEAVGKATGSTEAAVKAYQDSKAALEASLKAQGLLTPAVQAYIDKLYAVNDIKLVPTPLEIDNAAAVAWITTGLPALVASIRLQPINIPITANYSAAVATALGAARANIKLNLPGNAAGGLITGPGTSTSDSIIGATASGVPITRVSPNEFVVNAAATAKNRALLEAINSGQQINGSGGGGVNNFYMNPSGMNEEALAMDVVRRLNLMGAV